MYNKATETAKSIGRHLLDRTKSKIPPPSEKFFDPKAAVKRARDFPSPRRSNLNQSTGDKAYREDLYKKAFEISESGRREAYISDRNNQHKFYSRFFFSIGGFLFTLGGIGIIDKSDSDKHAEKINERDSKISTLETENKQIQEQKDALKTEFNDAKNKLFIVMNGYRQIRDENVVLKKRNEVLEKRNEVLEKKQQAFEKSLFHTGFTWLNSSIDDEAMPENSRNNIPHSER